MAGDLIIQVLYELLAIAFLIALNKVISKIPPFHRFVGEFNINDYRFPLNQNSVPNIAVPVIALVIPLIFIVGYYFCKRNLQDLHNGFFGLIFSVFIAVYTITDALKTAVGRPRPDFYSRCFPDNKPAYDSTTSEVICTGLEDCINEGYESFPAGHASWCFSGLGFLSLYLAGKICVFDSQGRLQLVKLAIVCTPLFGATYVGIKKIDDYWHHWQDVVVGALIGLTTAYLCYRQYFPSIYDDSCGLYPLKQPHGDWPPPANGSKQVETGSKLEVEILKI